MFNFSEGAPVPDPFDILPDRTRCLKAIRAFKKSRSSLDCESDDLIHDVFLSLYILWCQGKLADPKRAVWAKARHVVLQRLRAARYRAHVQLDAASQSPFATDDSLLAEDREHLRHLLRLLRPRLRAVDRACMDLYLEDPVAFSGSQHELAASLGMTPAKFRKSLHRIKKALIRLDREITTHRQAQSG